MTGRTTESIAQSHRVSESGPHGRRSFWLRRLHSATGVIPVGGFLVIHLWTNATAPEGRACFDRAVAAISAIPALPLIEVACILLPLAYHALFGLALTLESRPNVARYGYGHNWMYFFQRLTGLIALVFVLVHLGDFWILKVLGRLATQDFFDQLGRQLGQRWKALLYLFGTTACVVHFANGLRTFSFGMGLVTTVRGQRVVGWVTAVLGVVLWVLGTHTIVYLATGGSGVLPKGLLFDDVNRNLCEDGRAPKARGPH